MASEVPNLKSARPFQQTAQLYLDSGWFPFPLPPKQKFPPIVGYTGRRSKWPDAEQVERWITEDDPDTGTNWSKGNVGLHLGPIVSPFYMENPSAPGHSKWFENGEAKWCVIGIDVDHYGDKKGGDDLATLEERYGPLPETWVSTSRSDGISGIRYFLAPTKYSYRGQIATGSIEMVQQTHRFAAVYPSYHPKGGQYQWYPPGCALNGRPGTAYALRVVAPTKSSKYPEWHTVSIVPAEVPNAWELPRIPSGWLDYLTNGRIPFTEQEIDMDSSVDEIYGWARSTFMKKGGGRKGDPMELLAEHGCAQTKKAVDHWAEEILNDSTSHDKIVSAHWNLLNMGLEGHGGWMAAARAVEQIWVSHVLGEYGGEQKRGMIEARNEMFRSRTNALRKIKGRVEREMEDGRNLVGRKCGCYEGDSAEEVATAIAADLGDFSLDESVGLRDPSFYERNDDGNGEHFVDMYKERFHFVDGNGAWIFWDGKNWRWDEAGLARRAYRVVKARQQTYAEQLYRDAVQAKAAELEGAKELMDKARRWGAWAEQSGNNARAMGALEAAQAFEDVTVPADKVDGRTDLLGVENGIIELDTQNGWSFRQARKEDWVVSNTGVPFYETSRLLEMGGEYAEAVRLWHDYLKLFLPDTSVREWVQQMMGYTLFGRNIEKKLVFLFGGSNTGKTTMLNAIMSALGEYAATAELSIFSPRTLNPALAQALPKRIITTTEAGGQTDLSAEMIKRITGDDPMSAELKGVNTIIRRWPAFVPVIGTNNPPQIDGYDDALKRRIEVLPFDVQVKPSDAGNEIREHGSVAVLAWLVEGWGIYSQHHLGNKPEVLSESAKKFQQEMSGDLGDFFEAAVDLTGSLDDWVMVDEMYAVYKNWCNKNGIEKPWNKPYFGRKMSATGHKSMPRRVDGELNRFYQGVKLKQSYQNVLKFKRDNG